MKLFILSYIAIFFTFTPPTTDTNSVEFQPYIDKFENHTGIEVTVPISFTEYSPDNILGVCYVRITSKDITINKELWHKISSLHREFLIYHELVHCQCKQMTHIEGYLDNGCPKSMIHPKMMTWHCLANNYDYYINDMKQLCGVR